MPPSGTAPVAGEIGQAESSDTPRLAATLARAFIEDPVSRWLFSETATRGEKLRDFYEEVMLRRVIPPHGRILKTAEGAGAALWSPPGRWKPGLLTALRLAPHLLRIFRGEIGRARSGLAAIEKEHPSEPHWYLAVLGVEPERQGRGLGGALMAPVLEHCDAGAVPAYLEASTPRSRALYERNGFAVAKEVVMPHGGPPVWTMWREPRIA